MALIRSGLEADAEFHRRRDDEIEFRKAAKADGQFETLLEWERSKFRMEEKAAERDRLLNSAVSKTIQFYGLLKDGSGTVRDGPGIGLTATWNPRFLPRDQFQNDVIARQADTPDRSPVYWAAKVGGDTAARTWADGRVDIYIESFEKAAETGEAWEVALTLFHESVHFDDLTSRGRGGPNAAEYRAYSESVRIADSIGVPPKARAIVERQRDNSRLLAMAETVAPGLAHRFIRGPLEDYVETDARREFESRQRELESIRQEQDALAVNIEGKREERRLAAEAGNVPASGDRSDSADGAPRESERSSLDLLEIYAKSFCESPQLVRLMKDALSEWQETLQKVPGLLATLDYDTQAGTMPCYKYVTYQSISLHRNRYDLSNVDVLLGLVEEGLFRQTNPTPRNGRVEYAPPVSQPPAATPPGPLPAPEIGRSDERTLPSIPHCRYHPWCKG